jgi:hypothetical protein
MHGKPVLVPAPCPLCDKHKVELNKQDQSIRRVKKEDLTAAQKVIKEKNNEIYKEAVKWEAKKFYIVRGIDKGLEKDGVKFWRFKHNYRNQGTLDKLLPILDEYVTLNQKTFYDPMNGTDLSIIMADSEFNGRVYKSITAITYRGTSQLHADAILANEWLKDDTTWRDIFLPKKAPNITPFEYLEMAVNGTTPYWDDTDSSKKRWVFPGRPDLEEAANNRERNLDADYGKEHEMASDLAPTYHQKPVIDNSNITNMAIEVLAEQPVAPVAQAPVAPVAQAPVAQAPVAQAPVADPSTFIGNDTDGEDYDDLPF